MRVYSYLYGKRIKQAELECSRFHFKINQNQDILLVGQQSWSIASGCYVERVNLEHWCQLLYYWFNLVTIFSTLLPLILIIEEESVAVSAVLFYHFMLTWALFMSLIHTSQRFRWYSSCPAWSSKGSISSSNCDWGVSARIWMFTACHE